MRLQEEIASYSKYTSKILGKSSCGSDEDIGGAGHFGGTPLLMSSLMQLLTVSFNLYFLR